MCKSLAISAFIYIWLNVHNGIAQESFESYSAVSSTRILPLQSVRIHICRAIRYEDTYYPTSINASPDYSLVITLKKQKTEKTIYDRISNLENINIPRDFYPSTSGSTIRFTSNSQYHVYSRPLSICTPTPSTDPRIDTRLDNFIFYTPDAYQLSLKIYSQARSQGRKELKDRDHVKQEFNVEVIEPTGDDRAVYQAIITQNTASCIRALLSPTDDVPSDALELSLRLLSKYPNTAYANDLRLIAARSYLRGSGYRPFEADWQERWESNLYRQIQYKAKAKEPPDLTKPLEYDPYYFPSRSQVIGNLLQKSYVAQVLGEETRAKDLIAVYSAWRWPSLDARKKAQEHLSHIADRKYAFYSIAKMMSALNERELSGKISPELLDILKTNCAADQEFIESLQLLGIQVDDPLQLTTKYYEMFRKELFKNAKKE